MRNITKMRSRSAAGYILLTVALIFSMTGLAVAAPVAQEQAQSGILDVLREQGQFTTLIEALETAELVERLRGNGPFTIFAPTDKAFAQLPTETVEDLFNNQAALTDLLLYHVVEGQVAAGEISQMKQVESLTGRFLNINSSDGSVTINGVQVMTPDLQARNGVIHVVDTVLMPPIDEADIKAATAPEDTTSTQEDAGQIVTGCAQTYLVQAGDSLSQLAERFLGDLNSYQVIIDATHAAVADNDSQFSQIDDPNVITVGQALCIPASPEDSAAASNQQIEQTPEQMAQDQALVSVPEGKSKIIFENLSSVDLVVDLSGPTPGSLVVAPGAQQEFVLDPGPYGYNGHQPGGDFGLAPGQIQLEAGAVMGLTCYDSSQCQVQAVEALLTAQEQSRPGQEINPGAIQQGTN